MYFSNLVKYTFQEVLGFFDHLPNEGPTIQEVLGFLEHLNITITTCLTTTCKHPERSRKRVTTTCKQLYYLFTLYLLTIFYAFKIYRNVL